MEKNNDIPIEQVVSQSSQLAPFMHDYLHYNHAGDWVNFNSSRTRANSFRGSAVQQSSSAPTQLPADMFQGAELPHSWYVFCRPIRMSINEHRPELGIAVYVRCCLSTMYMY